MANSIWTPSDPSLDIQEIHSFRNEDDGTLSGNPQYSTRLEVPYQQLSALKTALLGEPEGWPHLSSIIQDVVCVQCKIKDDVSSYTTDSTGSLIHYDGNVFVDVVYMPRVGRYVVDANGEDVYWNDETAPRIESRPIPHKTLIWGTTTSPTSIPNDKIPLHSDEAPSIYENAQSLIHTIESWDIDFSDLKSLVGTVHNASYVSPVSGDVYAAGTLLLKNYANSQGYYFTSYRHGASSAQLKLFYEFRGVGWQRFWRNDIINNTQGYYYILRNANPWDAMEPFPQTSHNKYLGWVP